MSGLMLVLLTWTAPTVNCDGTPLTDLVGYMVTWEERACDGSTDEPTCEPRNIEVGIIIGADRTSVELPMVGLPAVGEAWWWRVDALDGDGNTSADCHG